MLSFLRKLSTRSPGGSVAPPDAAEAEESSTAPVASPEETPLTGASQSRTTSPEDGEADAQDLGALPEDGAEAAPDCSVAAARRTARDKRRMRASAGSFRGRDTFPEFDAGGDGTLPVPIERGIACIADVDDEDDDPDTPEVLRRRIEQAVAEVAEAECAKRHHRSVAGDGPPVKDLVDEVLTNVREEKGLSASEVFETIDKHGRRVLAPTDVIEGLRELDVEGLLQGDGDGTGRRRTFEFLDFFESFERHGDGKVHMASFETYCRALPAPIWCRERAPQGPRDGLEGLSLPPVAGCRRGAALGRAGTQRQSASHASSPQPNARRLSEPASLRTTF